MSSMRRLFVAAIVALVGAATIVGFGMARPSLASPRTLVPQPGSTRALHSTAGLATAGVGHAALEILRLMPTQGPVAGGTRVTIAGSGFTTAASVEFGGVAAASVHVLSPSVLTAVTPAHAAGPVSVVVTTKNGSTSEFSGHPTFGYIAAPTVSGVSPVAGSTRGNTRVTVTGSGFTAGASVLFGTTPGFGMKVLSARSLTVHAPAHAEGMVDVHVLTAGGTSPTSSADQYSYVVPPSVTALTVDQLTTSSVTLTWANPPLPSFRGVLIDRVDGTTAPASVLAGRVVALRGGQDIWTDAGLKPGHTYSYAVFADEGSSGYAPPATIAVTVPTHPELTGKITDSGGNPIAGVTVTVLDAGGTEASHAITGDNGSWAVAGLDAGAYTVCFEPAGSTTGPAGHGFLPQCWRDVSPDGTPAPVTVDPAATRTGLDAELADAGGISGTITSATGSPVPNAAAVVYDSHDDVADAASAGTDGTWHVSGLADGAYTVCFYPPDDDASYAFQCYEAATPATAQQITVTSGTTVTGINAVLAAAAPVSTTASPTSPRTAVLQSVTRPQALARDAADSSVIPIVTSTDDLPQQACADVLFLGARGSAESGPGGHYYSPVDASYGLGGEVYSAYQDFVGSLDGRSTTAPISVSYPADNPTVIATHALSNAYIRDLDSGVTTALTALVKRSAQCPHERIVLAGFSSGAMVMHRVLWTLNGDRSDPAYASILSRLDAAILIGDGDRVADDDTIDYGSALRGAQGIGTQYLAFSHTIDAPLPADIAAKTLSVCDASDFVCDNHANPLTAINAYYDIYVHTHHYIATPIVEKAAAAAARLENAVTAPMPVITTTSLPDAVIGQPYSTELTTADHRDGTWAVTGGSLPDGLTLSGYTIGGTPTTLGLDDFTLQFTDDYNETVTADANLQVVNPDQGGGGSGTGSLPGDLTRLPLPPNAADPSVASQVETADCGPSTCVAAGGYEDSDGNTHMALWLWNDSGWTVTEAPEPASSLGTYDYALWSSCGTQRCVVSGSDVGSAGDIPVFWTWSGDSWSAAPVPVPADSQDVGDLTVLAVSCGGSGLCAATGRYQNPSGQQVALWTLTDGTWSVTTAPLPADARTDPQAQGDVVSCGTTTCFAYGSYYTSAPYLVSDAGWSWTAGSWAAASLLPIDAAALPDLRILSAACLTSTCFTAFAYDDAQGNNDNAVAEYANGAWSPAALPLPADAQAPATLIVDGAACGWDECLVSASYFDASFSLHKMWWTWSDGDWTAIPVPAADDDDFADLSCGAGICAAEDDQLSSLWVWSAGSATVSQEPFPYDAIASPDGSLACGTGQCAALGSFTDTSGTSESALLISSGGPVSAAYYGATSYETANPLVTLACGAGICLAGG